MTEPSAHELIRWAKAKACEEPRTVFVLGVEMAESADMGTDRSREAVKQIHFILLHRFAHDTKYGDLAAAVDSFVPGGAAPFIDDVRLADAFRVFLRQQRIPLPDEPRDQPGDWPPPPRH